jgi:hypothetical protein
MSLCVPVAPQAQLLGIACVDVTMDTLFTEVKYFQQSLSAYAFLIDGYGRLLIHPLLPQPQTLYPDASVPDLTQIEYDYSANIYMLQRQMIT